MDGEAKKNQAAFGRAGKHIPPDPLNTPMLNGSFQKPKPQVPGVDLEEERAYKERRKEGDQGKARRGSDR